jgi:hypothetical protein
MTKKSGLMRVSGRTAFAALFLAAPLLEAEGAGPSYVTERNDKGEIIVDGSNFTIAETDRYFVDHSKEHEVNTFRHSREMLSVDNQFVVRENRDVMYSHAVVDISEGATLINPAWDVFSVLQMIDENQYTRRSTPANNGPSRRTTSPSDIISS